MRRLQAAILFLSSIQLFGCGNRVVGWPDDDDTAPTVTSTRPANDETDVALDARIEVTFDEAMDPATLTARTFTLEDGNTSIAGVVTRMAASAVFDPTDDLDPDTEYTATVTDEASDLAGNPLARDYVWTFTTEAEPTSAPTVASTSPADGATDVALDTDVSATFSEPMDPLTMTTATFTLEDGSTSIDGTVTQVGAVALFDPADDLEPDTEYTATITDGAADLDGNALAADYVWTFTTSAAVVPSAPRVLLTDPEDDEMDVPIDATVSATFSEDMDPEALDTTSFIVTGPGATEVTGTLVYAGPSRTATFTPEDELAPDTVYTATVTTDVTALSGEPLAADYSWTFTTERVSETRRPRVTFTVPADDATGAPVGGNVVAVFSEAMDPATITEASFTVERLNTPVAGTVSYTNVTATFDPNTALAPNTTYTATITTMARDLAGNSLERNYVWNFRTGATLDTTRPTVVSTIPDDEAVDVFLDTNVSATFNEAMDPLSVDAATFTLEDGTGPIEGSVTQVGSVAIFNPTDDLEPDTEYTATITSDAMDLAGNALAEDYVWTFTTGSDLDEGAPTVVLTNPDDEDSDVPVDATVNATFSEAIDPLTLTTATFELTGPGTTEVTGTVLYDVASRIATFTPDDDLLPATTYTGTVTSGVTDLAGNPLEEDYVWSFSTGETPSDFVPVDLGTLSTFVAVAGAGLTNSNSSGTTTLNGDVGLSPTGTCMGDGSPCTALNPVINGTLYVNDPEGVAAQAKADLTAAYVDATSRPVGTTVNDITGMVLPPGVYTSDSTMSIAVGGTVTLDGEGDANGVWIFQIGSSLTVNNDVQVLLINGARAKNVFWAVFASSTLGSNVSFQGSILAGASNSVGTDSVVVGRLLCTTGAITLLSNTITLPPL